MTICILCGLRIEKQWPIPMSIEFNPPMQSGESGLDTLNDKYCCMSCYKSTYANLIAVTQEACKNLVNDQITTQ